MKKNFKKLLFFSVASLTSLAFVISCSPSSAQSFNYEKFNNFANSPLWEKLPVTAEGTLVSWTDGDTAIINYQLKNSDELVTNKRIRIMYLDTPETKKQQNGEWVSTTGTEFKFANEAKLYAEKIIPAGSKIKLIFKGTNGIPEADTYGRLIGTIFYGENFAKNFSVEMVGQGFSIPFTENRSSLLEDYLPDHYLVRALAEAFNEAYYSKKGIHSLRTDTKSFNYFDDIFKTRGIGSNISQAKYFIDANHPETDTDSSVWDNLKLIESK
ncbi:thermonuclease family protein [Mycoplasma iguanae]|uniref:Thermonuclease family protein n=1 Tax=Mycoplasma iguanae TaxID=292461 RepID=A0ABY5R8W1_9MOLU|nr:thermonuclease family protein [Mycoplasma iguanae]UVD81721.1 thermonuclease family protein [Mycoplasma iguanae]